MDCRVGSNPTHATNCNQNKTMNKRIRNKKLKQEAKKSIFTSGVYGPRKPYSFQYLKEVARRMNSRNAIPVYFSMIKGVEIKRAPNFIFIQGPV